MSHTGKFYIHLMFRSVASRLVTAFCASSTMLRLQDNSCVRGCIAIFNRAALLLTRRPQDSPRPDTQVHKGARHVHVLQAYMATMLVTKRKFALTSLSAARAASGLGFTLDQENLHA